MIGKSHGSTLSFLLGLAALLSGLCLAAPLNAQTAPNGRWEFVVTSGDTQNQLTNASQTTFSTYLALSGSVLSGNTTETTNTSAAEISCCSDIVTGTFTKQHGATTAVVVFSVPENDTVGQAAFNYTFTGTFNQNPSNSAGPTITGTYTTNAGPTYSEGTGTFVATWFPDFPQNLQTYMGGLAGPDTGNGPTDVPALLQLGTDSKTHDLIGTVVVPGLMNNGTLGTPGLNGGGTGCFAGPLTIQKVENPSVFGGVGIPFASGVVITIFAQDSAGTQLMLLGYSAKPNGDSAAVGEAYLINSDNSGDNTTTNNGTNNELIVYYGISGGPCDGFGGGDAPFHMQTKHEHSKAFDHPRGRR
jgi:hypothetical protein